MNTNTEIDELLKEIAALQHSQPELAYTKNEALLLICKNLAYEVGFALALNNKGNYFFLKDEADTALAWYIEADKILSTCSHWENAIIAKTNMAMVYNKINEQEKCLQIYREIEVVIADEPLNIKHAQLYVNIDVALLAMGNAVQAKEYALKGYSVCKQLNHAFGISLSANHVAGCCIELNEFTEAEKYLNECFEIDISNGFLQQLCMSNYRAGVIENKKKNHEAAVQHATKTIELLKDTPNAEIKIGALTILSEAYSSMERYKEAYEAQCRLTDEKMDVFSAEKAKTIVTLNNKYNIEKKEAQLRETQLLKLDAELKAIKSQMNPHFIFNVMNTVDSLININENEKARSALRKFSSLMRETLAHSNRQFVSLENEIELLKNYVELEKLSLGKTFNYQILVDENLDTTYEKIPGMMLQPLVENAIKHGLRHLEGQKELLINFAALNENTLAITIQDNGIGRKKSTMLNTQRKNHESFASNALEKRIFFLNQTAGKKISYTVSDVNAEIENTGTRIELMFAISTN